jgi:flagellar FliJ protein
MKKFNFRLEKIKRFKDQLEQNKRMKLAAKQAYLYLEKNKLITATETRNRYFSLYGVRKPGKINIIQLIIAKRYIDKLSRDVLEQTKQVNLAERDVDKAKNELLEASKEKKKYEKLKSRHLATYLQDVNREENRELDEFAAGAHVPELSWKVKV